MRGSYSIGRKFAAASPLQTCHATAMKSSGIVAICGLGWLAHSQLAASAHPIDAEVRADHEIYMRSVRARVLAETAQPHTDDASRRGAARTVQLNIPARFHQELDIPSLRTSLLAVGFTVLPTSTPNDTVLVAPNGMRLALNPNEPIRIIDHPVIAKRSNRCLPIPSVTLDLRSDGGLVAEDGQYHRVGNPLAPFSTQRLFDLDGDGVRDAFVPVINHPSDCVTELSWQIWIAQGDCGLLVGTIGPGWPSVDEALPVPMSGLRPLTTVAEHSQTPAELSAPEKVQQTITTSHFVAAKFRYRASKSTSATTTCFHCAALACQATAHK